jgi:hypothetical protein
MRINTCEHCLKVFAANRFKRLCKPSCIPLEALTSPQETLEAFHIGNGNTRTLKPV